MGLKLLVILLLALPTIYAKIQIEVVASENEAERSVDASGRLMELIPDEERQTFRIDDNQLKGAVQRHIGARPDDAFVRSPTPWGDLYQTYNWHEVIRTLDLQKAQIVGATSYQILLLTYTVTNNLSQQVVAGVNLTTTVPNTVFSFWNYNGGPLAENHESSYDIKTITTGVGNTTFSFTSKWGETVSKTGTVTFTESVRLYVQPNTTVRTEFYATRNTMRLHIDYEASLSGDAAVNYAKTCNGHHFWGVDINNVVRAAGVDPVLRATEFLDLRYYSGSSVIVRDPISNEALYSIPDNKEV